MACIIASWVPTASMTLCAEATGELLDAFDALVAAFDDDVGGAEIPRQLLAGRVTAHRDDAFGAELLGGQHAAQAHRAVAHHGHRLAGADVGRDGAEPPGAEDVGRGQQVRDEIGGRNLGVATRVPSASGTRIRWAWAPPRCRGSRD